MKKIVFIVPLLGFLSCKSDNLDGQDVDEQLESILEHDLQQVEKEKELIADQNWWITSNSVGDFKIGDPIPVDGKFENYELQQISYMAEGEKYDKIIVLEDQKKVVEIFPSLETPKTIHEIGVLSTKFVDDKNISVGKTIDDFFTAYPDAKIWYTHVSDRFVMETKSNKLQYELSLEDYSKKIDITSDMSDLKREDFKKDAKIQKIRIY